MTWIYARSLSDGDLARVRTYRGHMEGKVKKFKNGTIIMLPNGNDFIVRSLKHIQVWVNE